MLSAVVGSLGHAISYACATTSRPGNNEQGIIAAKSTLVIVPSACKRVRLAPLKKCAIYEGNITDAVNRPVLMDNWIEEIDKLSAMHHCKP